MQAGKSRSFSFPLIGVLCGLLGSATAARCERLPLPAELQLRVNRAIDRGIVYLVTNQPAWGTWTADPKNHPVAYAALPGLTLLECEEPRDHPAILAAASFVRQNIAKLDTTYDLSLAVLFLDRLGDPGDEKLIQTLALRLIAGQSPTGGWSYRCPVLGPKSSQQLLAALRPKAKTIPSLPASLRTLPIFRAPSQLFMVDPNDKSQDPRGTTDNSNSQFATLALWASRRHDVPMERTLTLIAQRFSTSQNTDGSWGYHYNYAGGVPEGPAMNCVGLLGLAIGHGLARDKDDQEKPELAHGRLQAAGVVAFHPPMSFLLLALDYAERKKVKDLAKKRGKDVKIVKGFVALSKHVGQPVDRAQDIPQGNLYFLWSVERVAVLYDLATIGEKNWYHWGAEMLVANQKPEGNWENGHYPGTNPVIDTCLALLFLKRANLASDLTTKLPFDPNALSSSIDAAVTSNGKTDSSPVKMAMLTGDIPPVKTAETGAIPAAVTPSMSTVALPSKIEPTSSEDADEPRSGRRWLWLLAGLALVLFITCGILLASYTLSKHEGREPSRRTHCPKARPATRPHRVTR